MGEAESTEHMVFVLDMRGVSRIRQDEVKSSDVFRCDKIYPNFSRRNKLNPPLEVNCLECTPPCSNQPLRSNLQKAYKGEISSNLSQNPDRPIPLHPHPPSPIRERSSVTCCSRCYSFAVQNNSEHCSSPSQSHVNP